MDVGVDTKAPLSDFYGPEVIDALTAGTESLQRWAIPQGQGDLLGAIQGEQPVANAVNEVSNGTPAEEAAQQAQDAISEAAESVHESCGTLRADAGDGGGRVQRSSSAPARWVRAGPRGPPGRLPADHAHGGHRLHDGRAADRVDHLVGFQQVRLLNLRQAGFIGDYSLENFKNVLGSSGFVDALVTTLVYSVGGTACAIGPG